MNLQMKGLNFSVLCVCRFRWLCSRHHVETAGRRLAKQIGAVLFVLDLRTRHDVHDDSADAGQCERELHYGRTEIGHYRKEGQLHHCANQGEDWPAYQLTRTTLTYTLGLFCYSHVYHSPHFAFCSSEESTFPFLSFHFLSSQLFFFIALSALTVTILSAFIFGILSIKTLRNSLKR